KGEIAPSVHKVIGSELSQELRSQFIAHFDTKLGAQIVVGLSITNRYGATIATVGPSAQYRFEGGALWRKAKESGSCAGDVELDEQSGQPVVPLAVPVTDAQGNFAGMIMATISADSITRNAVITYKKYETPQVRL